jgi:hypothetical protein
MQHSLSQFGYAVIAQRWDQMEQTMPILGIFLGFEGELFPLSRKLDVGAL